MVRFVAVFLLLAVSARAQSCFTTLAETRNFTLGLPIQITPLPGGQQVLYLRSGPETTALGLYLYDLSTRAERRLALPAADGALSAAEKARRERARMTLSGITNYQINAAGTLILTEQGPTLATLGLAGGVPRTLPGAWLAPRLSPDGGAVAAVRDNDLFLIDTANGDARQLTHTGNATRSNGLAEFAAAEELDRPDGAWWSPDGTMIAYEEAETAGVENHFIADPENPAVPPVAFRYPQAGTANAAVRLGLIRRQGGKTRWIAWDHQRYPYLADVIWRRDGGLLIKLLDRLQNNEVVLAVDPASGETRKLISDADPAWLNLAPASGLAGALHLPYVLPDGRFLWATEQSGTWQLNLYAADGSIVRTLAPTLPFQGLIAVESGTVLLAASADRLGTALYRVNLDTGTAADIAASPGLHNPTAGFGLIADRYNLADGTDGVALLDAAGHKEADLPSAARIPPALPRVQFLAVGPQHLDSFILRPADFDPRKKYPVILTVYAGPTVKTVLRAPRDYLEDQCLADQGFIVAGLDGRGTPGRGRVWERATKFDLIDLPLQDQVEGLRAIERTVPQIDPRRAGVTGWSFGGYFTAMATLRRPDIFAAGVAGAPVVDFADYDTAYTERYLGLPQDQPDAYRRSNVLTYADRLERPLLIIHGLTDDNVYFENTVKLTQALLRAGKPYDLLLLTGTHLLPDPVLRARVDEARAAFFTQALKAKAPLSPDRHTRPKAETP